MIVSGPVLVATLVSAHMLGSPLTLPETVAADPSSAFVNANKAYNDGDYGSARNIYRALIENQPSNGLLWYNLANTHLRTGQLGRAVAAYLRATSLMPRNADIRANLAFARKGAKDDIAPHQPSEVLKTLFFWHYLLSRAELVQLLIGLNALLWLTLGLRLWKRDSETLRWGAMLWFAGIVLLASSLFVRISSPRHVAVIIPPEAKIYSGTNTQSIIRFELHSGTEVRWDDKAADWIRISLEDGKQGWLPAEHVELLTL